jgi:CheY-like chemotaxis protein
MSQPESFVGVAVVVDDLESNRNLFADILRSLKMEVITAADGVEGLTAVRERVFAKNPPTIVFLDMMMPEMGGVECATLIRTMGYKGPIMAFSADVSAKTSALAKGAGVDHYFLKSTFNRALAAALINTYCSISVE